MSGHTRKNGREASALKRVIHALAKLPGIGEKTAARLAFNILRRPDEYTEELAQALLDLKSRMKVCGQCCNLSEQDPCEICADDERKQEMICVVEDPRDLLAIEKSREFKGLYHILHGSLSPIDGIGPDDLKIRELLERLGATDLTTEVIVATNPTVSGEATALYLSKLIKPLGIRVTRIAHGVPVGGSLEYIDEVTLSKALENRREI